MSDFSVRIVPGKEEWTFDVSASGEDTHRITDLEADTFRIGSKKDRVKVANKCSKHSGFVQYAYLYDKTEPFGKLYKDKKWEEVTTTVTAVSAEIVGEIEYNTEIVARQTLRNTSNHTGTYSASLSTSFENTIESSWSHESSVEVSKSVSCSVQLPGVGQAEGSTSLSLTETWGEGGSHSETMTVSTDAGVTVELGPGEAVEVLMSAMKGKMYVLVTYKAHLNGRMAAAYTYDLGSMMGSTHWKFESYPINDALKKSKVPTEVTHTQLIEISFCSEIHVELRDLAGAAVKTVSPSALTVTSVKSA